MSDPAGDTIVACSSPWGVGLEGILRLSGPEAIPLAMDVFRPDGNASLKGYTSCSGSLRLPLPSLYRGGPGGVAKPRNHPPQSPLGKGGSKSLSLPATLYIMRAPASYTREDVAEIHMLSAPPLLRAVLNRLVAAGARPAEPGEFTRRAFLNGRIDLVQAEGVAAMIRSRTEAELRAAAARLGGGLSRRAERAAGILTDVCTQVELQIDFAEEDLPGLDAGEQIRALEEAVEHMQAILEPGSRQTQARGDVHAALCGRPNAGKSSLFNAMLGADRAIVHHVPGTTTDAVADELSIGGVRLRIVDTAGAASEADPLIPAAQIAVFVLDGSRDADAWEVTAFGSIPADFRILAINKDDLPSRVTADQARAFGADAVVRASARTGEGVTTLLETLRDAVEQGKVEMSGELSGGAARRHAALAAAINAAGRARELLGASDALELAAVEIRDALHHIGELTGRVTTDAILDRIFGEFCIGK